MTAVRPKEYLILCDGRALCESRVFSTEVTETSARLTLQAYGWGYVSKRELREWVDLCPSHYAEHKAEMLRLNAGEMPRVVGEKKKEEK